MMENEREIVKRYLFDPENPERIAEVMRLVEELERAKKRRLSEERMEYLVSFHEFNCSNRGWKSEPKFGNSRPPPVNTLYAILQRLVGLAFGTTRDIDTYAILRLAGQETLI